MRRPVVFENEKQQLFGVLHYPPEARKLPAVLLSATALQALKLRATASS